MNRAMQVFLGMILCPLFLTSCTPVGAIVGGIVGVTTFAGLAPSNEIEQVYYLGVFDPQEQLPSTVYRLRVRGQASALNKMRFGSGWVPAPLIDSLGTTTTTNKSDHTITITKTGQDPLPTLPTGRKLMLFGPEGFREAPKDHRLVLVMGASPEKFFQAIDSALGKVAESQSDQQTVIVDRKVFEAMVQVQHERERLQELTRDIEAEFPKTSEEKP